MLRLSILSGFGARLRSRLGQLRLLRSGGEAGGAAIPLAEAPPAPLPWPARGKGIASRAGLLATAGLLLVMLAAILTADPDASRPIVMLDFTNASDRLAAPPGEGETAAHLTEPLGPVVDAALAEFFENGPYGPLPKVAPDGTLPAQKFARRPELGDGRAMVSVIVSGLGLNEAETRDAIERLPANISLAFSPYAPHLASLVALARGEGHEVFVQAPVEPFDYPASDPGPLVLLVDAPKDTNIDRLHHAMGQSIGYVGFLISGRARFATTQAAITPLVQEAKARGLLVLDDGSAPVSKTARVAEQAGALVGEVDRRLDERPSGDGTALALLDLERLAIERGRAIGATDLYPIAVDRLVRWCETLKAKGLVLQPVSAQILPIATDDNDKPSRKSADERNHTKRR